MGNRRKHDWRALKTEFNTSGITAKEFCRQKQINLNLWYKSIKAENLGFVKLVPVDARSSDANLLDISIGKYHIGITGDFNRSTLEVLLDVLESRL